VTQKFVVTFSKKIWCKSSNVKIDTTIRKSKFWSAIL